MIAKLKGTFSEVDGNKGLIETTNGVFYEVFLTPKLLATSLPGSEIELYTHLQVREDAHILFGFSNKNEKKLFELLVAISGVGPKTAYGVISFSSDEELFAAVRSNDVDFFSKVPGLGRKTAMKIILDLSQKLKSEFQMEKMYVSDDDKLVIDALVSLGFKSQDAKKVFSKLPKDLSVEEKIQQAIRQVSNPKK